MSEAKKAILARRAKFVAAALAGIACGKEPKAEPTVLAPMTVDAGALPPDASTDASASLLPEPSPCLSVRLPEPDASVDDASTGTRAKTKPRPPSPPQPPLQPRPQVCLSPPPMPEDKER